VLRRGAPGQLPSVMAQRTTDGWVVMCVCCLLTVTVRGRPQGLLREDEELARFLRSRCGEQQAPAPPPAACRLPLPSSVTPHATKPCVGGRHRASIPLDPQPGTARTALRARVQPLAEWRLADLAGGLGCGRTPRLWTACSSGCGGAARTGE
jgi:hypothetical protein